MARSAAIVLFAGVLAALSGAASAGETDPISKTMELLSSLEAKIIKEGEAAQKVYEEYSEWCSDKYKDLSYEIKTGKSTVADLKATILKESSIIESLTTKIEELTASIASEEADLKSATKLREEEASSFAAEEKELMDIVSTLERAIRQLNKGGASMMQLSRMPSILQALDTMVRASVISAADGGKLTALVQSSAQASQDSEDEDPGAPAGAVYESHSGGIIDTLEGLLEKAQEQLDALRKAETTALHNYEMLKQSLEDEMKFATKDLAAAKTGVAAASEAKSVAEGDLEVTSKDLASDVKELAEVHHSCEVTAADFESATTSRGEELKALAEAKSAISSSTGAAGSLTYGFDQVSFLQRGQAKGDVTNFQVVRFIRGLARKQGSTQLAQLANRVASTIRFSARVGQDPFAKVKGLITDLIASLEAAAETDASHKAYCDKETAETTEKKEDKTAEIAKLSTEIDKMASRIAVLEEEVGTLTKELAAIASSKASYETWYAESEATFSNDKADMEAGITGIQTALKVLNDYYAGDHSHAAAGGAASGIIGMLEVIESDFTKGLAEDEATFSTIKKDYEDFVKETEITVTTKEQDVKYKSEEITKLKKALGETTSDKKGVQAELDAILTYLGKLNDMCIAKAEPYEEMVARREAELAGLKEALAVLSGEAVLLQRDSRASRKGLRGVARHSAIAHA